MANYTTTITNEGAALLASVIANQGTLTFNEFRFSENDYIGQESTLTEGTFLGVFITASAAASVIDSTTIKASAQFNNSTITGNHDLYSIGIIGTDGNTTALIAVCTTTDPDVIREPLTGTSTYAFNVNLTVSDTSQITVVGTTAAVIYDIDVVDNLTSPATNKPLSANQGRLVADNLAANENVYGAKNLLKYPYSSIPSGGYGMTFTDNGDGTVTVSGIATADIFMYLQAPETIYLKNGQYKLSGTPHFGDTVKLRLFLVYQDTSNNTVVINVDNNMATGENTFTINGSYGDANGAACNAYIKIYNGADCSTPITFKPMIRDARILDPTFAPYAETNLQLTQNKAERDDLSTIHATGSTNTTGAQIDVGTFFYLNGQFCKALTNIAANATFTLNTNFEVASVGGELNTLSIKLRATASGNTYNEQLLSLKSAYAALTEAEKQRAFLTTGTGNEYIARSVSIVSDFTNTITDGVNLRNDMYNLNAGYFIRFVGITLNDYSSNIVNGTIKLYA